MGRNTEKYRALDIPPISARKSRKSHRLAITIGVTGSVLALSAATSALAGIEFRQEGHHMPPPSHKSSSLAVQKSTNLADKSKSSQIPVDVPIPPVVAGAPIPEGLKGVPVPMPSNLNDFIADKSAAIRLGKALFWDMQVGSDGKTACGTCHFNAGADSRSKNQVDPGLNRMASETSPNPDTTFQIGGPNYQFKAQDFPFHQFSDPSNINSSVVRTSNDIGGSQGVFHTRFLSATPGAVADTTNLAGDNVFQVGGIETRRVTPRNAPTVVNAIFNARLFWDGRANFLFNGANPFGGTDENARVYKSAGGSSAAVSPVQVRINNAALASLATGPALSDVEMSGVGRTWPEIGKRLLTARPLRQQKVSSSDSALGSLADSKGGLKVDKYEDLVKAAFKSQWWDGKQVVQIDASGKGTVVNKPANLSSGQYTQAQANFSLFFGLAIQMYGATLVSDDAPFDQFMAGKATALSPTQAAGMGVFFGKGRCANCHTGAEFSTASVRNLLANPLDRMVMGDGSTAVYDTGFNNTSVSKTLDDIAGGGVNGVGVTLSSARLAQKVGAAEFERLMGYSPGPEVPEAGERISANGAFKVPTIRNTELSAPYFHNGSVLTLEQVVEFYNRGGNHTKNNLPDHDPDVRPLGLSSQERAQLVAFLKSTTDERVRYARAPFDHPQIFVPHGHVGNTKNVAVTDGHAQDKWVEVPAVGAAGTKPLRKFLQDGEPSDHDKHYGDDFGGRTRHFNDDNDD